MTSPVGHRRLHLAGLLVARHHDGADDSLGIGILHDAANGRLAIC